MTQYQTDVIDRMSEDQLRKTSSTHWHDKEIVKYIDNILERKNVTNALVEQTDMSDMINQ